MSTVTEHPNAAAVRRVYDAFGRQDLEELERLLSPDVRMLMPGTSPLAGRYEGREAVFGFFGQLGAVSDGTYRAELGDLYANDDQVVALHHGTARRGDRTLDAHAALLFELSDGIVRAVTVHQQSQDGWDAFFAD
jgi:ketosteroid isomerase-like protein